VTCPPLASQGAEVIDFGIQDPLRRWAKCLGSDLERSRSFRKLREGEVDLAKGLTVAHGVELNRRELRITAIFALWALDPR
jgi:hypothetical protein